MSSDFCISCGALLAPYAYQCPACGFSTDSDLDEDFISEDQFFNAFNDKFAPEEDQID